MQAALVDLLYDETERIEANRLGEHMTFDPAIEEDPARIALEKRLKGTKKASSVS